MSTALQSRWTALYSQRLPQLARAKDPAQNYWPVHLDHCFARIILDTVIGASSTGSAPAPWTAKLKSPAITHMTDDQLQECISIGEAIANGNANLVELDERSLAVRGKLSKIKRKWEDNTSKKPPIPKRKKTNLPGQTDIRSAMVGPLSPPHTPMSPASAHVDEMIASEIESHLTLTAFRKRVLVALLQVPSGQYTTYLALSDFLDSSPRAVGNALRNNPLAPRVPCHRVVAADGGIGGFGGEWGVKGKWNEKKVDLLKREGVKVDPDGGRVRGQVWKNFESLNSVRDFNTNTTQFGL